jgi:hypothetical protein
VERGVGTEPGRQDPQRPRRLPGGLVAWCGLRPPEIVQQPLRGPSQRGQAGSARRATGRQAGRSAGTCRAGRRRMPPTAGMPGSGGGCPTPRRSGSCVAPGQPGAGCPAGPAPGRTPRAAGMRGAGSQRRRGRTWAGHQARRRRRAACHRLPARPAPGEAPRSWSAATTARTRVRPHRPPAPARAPASRRHRRAGSRYPGGRALHARAAPGAAGACRPFFGIPARFEQEPVALVAQRIDDASDLDRRHAFRSRPASAGHPALALRRVGEAWYARCYRATTLLNAPIRRIAPGNLRGQLIRRVADAGR